MGAVILRFIVRLPDPLILIVTPTLIRFLLFRLTPDLILSVDMRSRIFFLLFFLLVLLIRVSLGMSACLLSAVRL